MARRLIHNVPVRRQDSVVPDGWSENWRCREWCRDSGKGAAAIRELVCRQCEVILNDSDLVRGLSERDPAAVRHLSERWVPSVWRFVYVRVNGDRHLAEDIVSESVLALISAAADPDREITNPGGWLRSVAANKVSDHFRAAARVQHLLQQADPGDSVSSEQDPAGQQELTERREVVRLVLESLGESQRMALEWKYVDQLSVREIAARLDLTEKAAESVLFRARREFRARLHRCEDDRALPEMQGQEAGPSGLSNSGAQRTGTRRTGTQRTGTQRAGTSAGTPVSGDAEDDETEPSSGGSGAPVKQCGVAGADSGPGAPLPPSAQAEPCAGRAEDVVPVSNEE